MNQVTGEFHRRTNPIDNTVPGIANSASVRKFTSRCPRSRVKWASRKPRVIKIVAAIAE